MWGTEILIQWGGLNEAKVTEVIVGGFSAPQDLCPV